MAQAKIGGAIDMEERERNTILNFINSILHFSDPQATYNELIAKMRELQEMEKTDNTKGGQR